MKKRIIAACIMIPFAVAVLLANDLTVLITASLLALAASYEICASYDFLGKGAASVLVYVMFSPILTALLTLSRVKKFVQPDIIKFAFFIYLIVGFMIILEKHEKIKVRDVMSAGALCAQVTFFLMHAVNIRTDFELGKQYLWIVVVGACLTDTFALFVGKYFGKRKLAPKISPKKTVAGAIGGTLGSMVSVTLYGVILGFVCPDVSVNYPALLALGFLCAVFAQIGDLSMSAVKREAGIKDYGNIIPGHGGILDRIDSIVFAAPLVYYFLTYVKVFY